ncbi:glucan endo-1,3-beta-glucosidase 8-like [Vicia villosa]|uniref:glucan endo-1,3-beta-glucosidase 8-like n=1 Tax=Vicia villosa TaxID=3911 RepID=UPI00273CC608|nr:glucan endo-1,3-beta-glucosidase 8-like [Vicia villosa]
MVRFKFIMCTFSMIVVMAHCQQQGPETIPTIGVNWGLLSTNPIDPHIVVNMLKDNAIKKVKIFDTDPWILSAFSGTDIEVMVGIPNDQLKKISGDMDEAEDWVKNNVSKHMHDGGVNIRYVSVGNEAFLTAYNGSFVKTTFPAMENIQKALNNAGLGNKIKVTSALNADVYDTTTDKPSGGHFRKDIYDAMKQIVKFLDENNSPFLVNIYPFLSLYQNDDFPKDYAFFDSTSRTITDNNERYSNVFDANLDTLAWALKKAGHPKVSIMIGEIGWPTDGNKHATITNAKRFYSGFLKKWASKKGSPLRPEPKVAYLFSLVDENTKSVAPGNFERHWGMFRYDGKPKFPIDLSGKDQEKMLVGAKGIRYLEKKWCVLSKDIKNMSSVGPAVSYACSSGDCTSLGPGCSCASLNEAGNASFAFNQFFQNNEQSVEACDFDGLATIVEKDPTPSNGNCVFPIQIQSGGTMLRGKTYMVKGLLIGFLLFFITFI